MLCCRISIRLFFCNLKKKVKQKVDVTMDTEELSASTSDAQKEKLGTRKTRFVLLSDTHNSSPFDGQFKVPDGDVLIHAGDLTNQGTLNELSRTMEWIGRMKHEVKIVIAGNHDITLDEDFYQEYWSYYHNQYPQSSKECKKLMNSNSKVLYLCEESAEITLRDPTGPQTRFKVYGSPRVPDTCGLWAFTYNEAEDGQDIWAKIPADTDILVTHGPPKYHLDTAVPGSKLGTGNIGCEELRLALGKVRPRMHVFGHVHQSRGVERVQWDNSMKHLGYRENPRDSCDDPLQWIDPGLASKKRSLCDVSSGTGQFGGKGLSEDETLMVNASIFVTKSAKNKPIVVDLDLPVAV